MKRGLAFVIFAILSLGAVMVLFGAWFSWSMADFDCIDGYWACRQPWLLRDGPWVAGVILAWIAAAVWLYRTREKF